MNKIFVLGYYGWSNTGDDAMLFSLLQTIHSKNPIGYQFSILSRNNIYVPSGLRDSVRIINDNQKLNVFREIINSDLLILGGGTHLFDYGNSKNRLLRLSQFLVITKLFRILHKNVYFLGIGIEHPKTKWGKILIREICRSANFISVRDSWSFKILNDINIDSNSELSFDLTALLELPRLSDHLPSKNYILGVSILPFYDIYYKNKGLDSLFVNKIADGLNFWLENDELNRVHLFLIKNDEKDILITSELYDKLRLKNRVKIISYDRNPINTLVKISECTFFLGMRYHSCVFAYLSNIPLLVIRYAEKNQSLAEDICLSTDAIISLDEILNGELKNRLEGLLKDPDKFRSSLSINEAKKRSLRSFKLFK